MRKQPALASLSLPQGLEFLDVCVALPDTLLSVCNQSVAFRRTWSLSAFDRGKRDLVPVAARLVPIWLTGAYVVVVRILAYPRAASSRTAH